MITEERLQQLLQSNTYTGSDRTDTAAALREQQQLRNTAKAVVIETRREFADCGHEGIRNIALEQIDRLDDLLPKSSPAPAK